MSNPNASAPSPIAVQMYSLRAEMASDPEATIEKVGAMGFVGVEAAGFAGLTPSRYAQVVESSGMRIASAHIGDLSIDAVRSSLDEIAAAGCDTAVVAYIPPAEFADIDSIARNAARIQLANDEAKARGIRLGYHNHWWEFEQSFNGKTAWEALFDRLDPSIFAELDLYWVSVAKHDPEKLLRAEGARIHMLHVKDGPADVPESPMVAVGSGALDIGRILSAKPTVHWHVVELDRCASDMLSAVADSYAFLTAQGLSAGRSK